MSHTHSTHPFIPASFSQRLLAHNIDLVPILLLFYGYIWLLPDVKYDIPAMIIIYLGYHLGFELSPMRGTVGKKWVGLQIVHLDNQSGVRPEYILMRNICKIGSLVVFFLGFTCILFHKAHKSWHDLASKTKVVLK